MSGQDSHNPQQTRNSFSEQLDEELRAEALKYNDMCDELGLAFQAAQEETFEQWLAWQREMEASDRNPR